MNGHAAPTADNRGSLWVVAAVVSAVLQLIVGYFTLGAIGLISVPLWAIVVLAGLWLAAVALLVRSVRRAPLLALLVPVANALALWGVVAAGGALLGWNA